MKAGIVLSISVGVLLVLGIVYGASLSPDENLYGTWEGDRDWRTMGIENEEAARGTMGVTLELRGSRTFQLRNRSFPFEGSWVQSGKAVDLRVETIYGRPAEIQQESMRKAAEFKVRYENGRMFFRDPGDDKEIELKKKTKPPQ